MNHLRFIFNNDSAYDGRVLISALYRDNILTYSLFRYLSSISYIYDTYKEA